jgi:hypothetical protein
MALGKHILNSYSEICTSHQLPPTDSCIGQWGRAN